MSSLKLLTTGIINASKSELNLRACLKGGMCFRWVLDVDDPTSTQFTGIIGEQIYRLKQTPGENVIEYSVYGRGEVDAGSVDSILKDYFRLSEDLPGLYSYWASRDGRFKEKVDAYSNVIGGIRVLRLDPVENLFSFICSSNNGIPRITQMVANICIHFGKLIGNLDDVPYYSFPTIESLAQKGVDTRLRELKFGYRAKFIQDAAVYLGGREGGGENWLHSMRSRPYGEVHAELVKIPGVGKKVADCVCLMSLDKLEAIPVDTHVFQMARVYGFVKDSKGSNSLSDTAYRTIADKFRDLWGKYAGWAQTVMFVDDLREFKKQKSDLSLPDESKKRPLTPSSKTRTNKKKIKS